MPVKEISAESVLVINDNYTCADDSSKMRQTSRSENAVPIVSLGGAQFA